MCGPREPSLLRFTCDFCRRHSRDRTAQLRDLAASAARIFGWDSDKPGVQLNQQFVLTQEQIDRIGEAADADDPYKKPATR
jgi:hypothetical protein